MENKKLWSAQAWAKADHIYEEILELPFVKQLADGTLDKEIFNRYIGQDSLYINRYCKVLAHIASRLNDARMTADFLGFAQDGVEVERALHSQSPVEVEAAAILPCFWVYLKVGKHIAATMKEGNPYSAWIATYSDPVFDASNDKAIALCDELAEKASPEIRERMTEIFVEATRMEWLFWHGAYEDLKWPENIR